MSELCSKWISYSWIEMAVKLLVNVIFKKNDAKSYRLSKSVKKDCLKLQKHLMRDKNRKLWFLRPCDKWKIVGFHNGLWQ